MMQLKEKLNVDLLNEALDRHEGLLEQPIICFLTGSSGCGKTYLAKAIEQQLNSDIAAVVFFDTVGVPSEQEMIEKYGSGEAWQEATTHQWVQNILHMRDKKLVIFEGQYHPRFAIDAVYKFEVEKYTLSVVTCNEEVWESRLRGPREQPELIDENMRNWAKVLREETISFGGSVIDTSKSDLEENISDVVGLILPVLKC